MKRDDLLAMARAAGLQRTNPGEAVEVVRFAEMVAAKEREACAQLCDATVMKSVLNSYDAGWAGGAEVCADRIRARGQKDGA